MGDWVRPLIVMAALGVMGACLVGMGFFGFWLSNKLGGPAPSTLRQVLSGMATVFICVALRDVGAARHPLLDSTARHTTDAALARCDIGSH